MNIKRIARHLLATHWQVNRAFPRTTLLAIEHAIKGSETAHSGQVRFAVEGALDGTPLFNGQSARERAIEVFAQLRIWDTEHNNGVLIYLLLADRAVEIVADRGIQSRMVPREWETICRQMEAAFRQAAWEAGAVTGIQSVSRHLIEHFPASDARPNELSDKPVVL